MKCSITANSLIAATNHRQPNQPYSQRTMKNQTAVEWLLEEWPILESQIPPRIIDQAKALDKENIEQAYWDGYQNITSMKPEQYYNETFTKPEPK